MRDRLKISIVSDIHCGPDHETKVGTAAGPLLQRFVDHVEQVQPDFVVDLGDRITDRSLEDDREHLLRVSNYFDKLNCPRRHLIGNHDIVHMSRRDNAELLRQDVEHSVVDISGWRLILWQPHVGYDDKDSPLEPAGETDIKWLADATLSAAGPAIVFSHIPVSESPLDGNSYFEKKRRQAYYPNSAEIRSALNGADVALWVAGHVHWNNHRHIDGVDHVTVQSLTEAAFTSLDPAGAFADLEAGPDGIKITVHGLDGDTIKLPN